MPPFHPNSIPQGSEHQNIKTETYTMPKAERKAHDIYLGVCQTKQKNLHPLMEENNRGKQTNLGEGVPRFWYSHKMVNMQSYNKILCEAYI